jgi:hypothetical protein
MTALGRALDEKNPDLPVLPPLNLISPGRATGISWRSSRLDGAKRILDRRKFLLDTKR